MPHFVELAVVFVEDEDVAVAVAVGSALDRGIVGDGVGAGIALVGVLEGDGDLRLVAADDDVGNAVRVALPGGAEVGVKALVQANAGDEVRRVGVDGIGRDIGILGVVGRQNLTAGDGGRIGLSRLRDFGLRFGFAAQRRECEAYQQGQAECEPDAIVRQTAFHLLFLPRLCGARGAPQKGC